MSRELIRSRLLRFVQVGTDAITYALVVAAGATIVALALGITTGGGFVRGKAILFVIGFVLMAYSTVRLWPSSPEDVSSTETNHGNGRSIGARAGRQTRFQRFVALLPPLRWIGVPPPHHRLSSATKLFVSSLVVFLVSYLMERWFGIV